VFEVKKRISKVLSPSSHFFASPPISNLEKEATDSYRREKE
jgi:hypothetical protein